MYYDLYIQKTGSDGHKSIYSIAELRNIQKPNKSIYCWNGNEIVQSAYARVQFTDYMQIGSEKSESMAKCVVGSLIKYGVAFIENVPANMTSTESAIRRLFDVQKTFYGEMWEFTGKQTYQDPAYTAEALDAHTDHMYFNDASGLQIFHCIHHDGNGGQSFLVDGFKVLEQIKMKDNNAYDRLCRVSVPAEYIDHQQHHAYCAPIIRLDPISQKPQQIR